MSDSIRDYLSEIGKRGGEKRAAHPLRIEMARNAALARWKHHCKADKHKPRQVAQSHENKV